MERKPYKFTLFDATDDHVFSTETSRSDSAVKDVCARRRLCLITNRETGHKEIESTPMVPPYDLFRKEENDVVWIGAATLGEARDIAALEMMKAPCEYLIVSMKTGKREVVLPNHPRADDK